ncbi:MAG: hypothetical protein HY060_22285 [Proteobacteria bacterium]|nr:hypothetical protein [Pseudomonadota bacterium]
MANRQRAPRVTNFLCAALSILSLSVFPSAGDGARAADGAPTPLLKKGGQPVDWWFTFKFNAASFPGCGGAAAQCPFGGDPQKYREGEQYVYASKTNPTLQKGSGCSGETDNDPLGATFGQVYNGTYNYVVWNDQFYDDPPIAHCTKECGSPWGHSKGMLAWNDAGAGVVLQVSTPSWPAAGSKRNPRTDGNTLGCIKNDDDIKVSQHFFALKLTKADVLIVLDGLANASIVTDIHNLQIVKKGGPTEILNKLEALGRKSSNTKVIDKKLSSGARVISKPSDLEVPPWQMVSAQLGGVALRAATWWASPQIPTTTTTAKPACWDGQLATPGPVAIATTGHWGDKAFGLKGGPGDDFNHAKVGVSTTGSHPYVIFGDMNQQGALSGNCKSSQNGRGGLFFVVENAKLHDSVAELIKGETAPTQ